MQLDSFTSDPSPSATARDNASASPEPESASNAPDIACELSSLQSSLHTSLQPFLDNFFVHSSSTTTKNEVHNTSASRTSISGDNNIINAEPTSTETVTTPFMPTLLNHSEPLDLQKEPSLPLSLSLPLPEHHLVVQVFPSCSSSMSSSSPPFLLTPPLTPELPTTSCRGSKSRESESGKGHKRDKKTNKKQTTTTTNQAPGTPVSEPSCLQPIFQGAEQDCHDLEEEPGMSQREAEKEEQSELQSYRGDVVDSDIDCSAKSPRLSLAHHPHIIYPTTTSSSSSNRTESVQEAEYLKDLDLDHGPQDLLPVQQTMQHQEQETHPQQQTQHHLVQQLQHHPHHDHQQTSTHLHHHHNNNNTNSTTNTSGSSSIASFSTCAFSFSAQPEGLPPKNKSHACEHDVRHNSASSSSAHAPLSPSSPGQGLLGETQRSNKTSRGLSGAARGRRPMTEDEDEDEDEDDTRSGDYFSMGAKKRSTSAGMATYNIVKKRRKSRTENSMAHALQFLERRSEQQQQLSARAKDTKEPNRWHIQDRGLDFDPSRLVRTWSLPHELVSLDFKTNLKPSRHRPPRSRMMRPNEDDEIGSSICQLRHPFTEVCQCRKRIYAVAIELSRPLSTGSTRAIDHYPGWVESIKKRKIHQNPTKWTSTLSPSPYVKLLTIRNFWDVMGARLGPSSICEKARKTILSSSGHDTYDTNETASMEHEATDASSAFLTPFTAVTMVGLTTRKSKTVQFRCPAQFLRGLWEEELRNQRVQQMIPDTVRRPPRSKVFNSKPISATTNANAKPALPSLFTTATSSSSATGSSTTTSSAPNTSTTTTTTNTENAEVQGQTSSPSQTPVLTEMELSFKKKHRAAAIIRSHAITEGSDMAEYKPWKDGTVTPHQGSLQSLKELRCNIMDPWPAEESKSKDECTRILHRMREQLNIVINLQIHLRSMIKTAPTQWSFLLSIRHPGQVSIELLLALYGPHFLQTSNFRAIEQLLWGATKGQHSQVAQHMQQDEAAATPVHPDDPLSSTMSPA